MTLQELKDADEAPHWYEEKGYTTVCGGYLLPGETPRGMYRRVAKSTSSYAKRPDLEEPFFQIMWQGLLGPATPVLCNIGTTRGLPISCFIVEAQDSIDSIFKTSHEVAVMSKSGGGVGIVLDNLRPRGASIKTGGQSSGIVPWCRLYDTTVDVVAQGSRRGAGAANYNIKKPDWDEFIEIRNTEGDPSMRVNGLHHCTVIEHEFMEKALAGDEEAVRRIIKLISTRWENGESYVMFYDHVNAGTPKEYKDRGYVVKGTNICSEILQYTSELYSVVCCLSSLNLLMWEQIKILKFNNMGVIELSVRFLDAVLEEFLDKGQHIEGLQKAVAGARAARSIGLGIMGWHSLLQSKSVAFDTSWDVMQLNAEISRTIRQEADATSNKLAVEYGEPEWLVGSGRRNMHLMAYAPTRSNSTICGGISPSIEPWISNYYMDESSKGDFPTKNRFLEDVLTKHGKNDWDVWKSIMKSDGSVQQLDFLTDHEKRVFRTAREMDQKVLITQAAQRQRFVDQGQSLNLFYPVSIEEQKVVDDFIFAWQSGIMTLYYKRTGAAIKGDIIEECESCHG